MPTPKSKHWEMTSVVLVPDTPDYHGDIYTSEEVHKGCRDFRENGAKAFIDHEDLLTSEEAEFVENYVTKGITYITDPKGQEVEVPEGTWVSTMKFKTQEMWNKVLSGEYTGFSIHARCKAYEVTKAKAGYRAAQDGAYAKTRLTDFKFDGDNHHVSLVKEAANGVTVLAIKSKNKEKEPTMTMTVEEIEEMKARNAKLEAESKAAEVSKAKAKEAADLEVSKAKEALEVEVAKQKEIAEKQQAELEVFKAKEIEVEKARVIEVTKACTTKAKELLADDDVAFGKILFKCKEGKALDADEYSALEDQLGKLVNISKGKEVLKDKGEADITGDTKTADDKFDEKYDALIKDGMSAYDAAIEASK